MPLNSTSHAGSWARIAWLALSWRMAMVEGAPTAGGNQSASRPRDCRGRGYKAQNFINHLWLTRICINVLGQGLLEMTPFPSSICPPTRYKAAADMWNSTGNNYATNALETLWREFLRRHSAARETLLLLSESESNDTGDTPNSDNDLV